MANPVPTSREERRAQREASRAQHARELDQRRTADMKDALRKQRDRSLRADDPRVSLLIIKLDELTAVGKKTVPIKDVLAIISPPPA